MAINSTNKKNNTNKLIINNRKELSLRGLIGDNF